MLSRAPALKSGIVAAPSLFQHAVERVERSGEVPLRGKRSTEPFQRARFSVGVGTRAIQLAAAPIIDNGAAEVSFDELDIAGVDER